MGLCVPKSRFFHPLFFNFRTAFRLCPYRSTGMGTRMNRHGHTLSAVWANGSGFLRESLKKELGTELPPLGRGLFLYLSTLSALALIPQFLRSAILNMYAAIAYRAALFLSVSVQHENILYVYLHRLYADKLLKRKQHKFIKTMKNIDWANLSFGYIPTDYNVRCRYRNGAWGEIEVSSSEYLNIHMAATCLHYGQEAFEGLKAYDCKDGKIRIFRMDENAARLQSTCRGILMPELPTEIFEEMVKKVVLLNKDYIPPYGTGASLYIRPLLIGIGAQVGVHPTDEYLFVIFVTPVGPYFKGGFATNDYVIIREYDRSAPLGTGIYKVGGNYAASLKANQMAHEKGYACEFYLDAKEKKYIDECGAANFFGIKNNTYITPKSTSILPSITNKSLMQLAEDYGMKVERRQIPEEELSTFEEAGACGTAAVISPIGKIDDLETGKSYVISKDGKPGPMSTKLYNHLRGIQLGDEPDTHGWVTVLDK